MPEAAAEPKKKLSRRRKVIYLIVVYFLLAAAVEIGLKISKALHDAQTFASTAGDDEGSIVFLCIGDSMTYGLGAGGRENSYPMHLDRFWGLKYPDVPFKVYNIGMSGYSTSNILHRLGRFFVETPEAKPDFALLLLGINNRWNLQGATFWEWEKEAKKNNYTEYLASKLQLGKVFNMASGNAMELVEKARQTNGVQYKNMLSRRGRDGWDMFFKSFDDELLLRWIDHDIEVIVGQLRLHGVQPIFLPYHFPVLPQLNDLIREIAKKHEAPLLDIEKPAAYYDARKYYILDNYHLNAEGYKDLASRVIDKFAEVYTPDAIRRVLADKKKNGEPVKSASINPSPPGP